MDKNAARIVSIEDIEKSINISEDTVHKTRVRVIGVGGGGGTIVSEIIYQ